MTDKKVLKEDVYPEGHWAPTFRAGDEVDEVHVKMFGLEDKVVGANTKTAAKVRSNRAADAVEGHPNGAANDPDNVDTIPR